MDGLIAVLVFLPLPETSFLSDCITSALCIKDLKYVYVYYSDCQLAYLHAIKIGNNFLSKMKISADSINMYVACIDIRPRLPIFLAKENPHLEVGYIYGCLNE